MPAVWEAIIDNKTFARVQKLLKVNKERYHTNSVGRYSYYFSGLFRCGLCGEKLQGKSAYSSSDKKHYYYSHKSTCRKGGLNRIDAELVHSLVFDWLKDISVNSKRFRELQERGKARLRNEHALLKKECLSLNKRLENINSQIEARIRELCKTSSEVIRKTIEQSIEKLKQQSQETQDKKIYIKHTISELEIILNSKDLFKEYSSLVQDALGKIDNSHPGLAKAELQRLLAVLALYPTQIKTALSGVNRKGLCSSMFAPSPPDRLELPT